MDREDCTRRKHDAEDTRARLVSAAQQAFTHAKFEDVNVRALAQGADANPALVNRYFGGKQGLFEACFADLPSDNPLQSIAIDDWPEFLAQMMVGKMDSRVEFDPLLAMLRSSQSATVGGFVRETLQSNVIARLYELMPDVQAREAKGRALLAMVLGVDVIERMFELPYDQQAKLELKEVYRRAIAAIIMP